MTTFAPDDVKRQLSELAERAREAWDTYAAELRELEGRDYEEAEDASWERLQRELRVLDEERAELQPAPAAHTPPAPER